MIEVASDNTPPVIIPDTQPAAPAVIPDAALTSETVQQHNNFEVHTPALPEALAAGSLGADLTAPVAAAEEIGNSYASEAVNMLSAGPEVLEGPGQEDTQEDPEDVRAARRAAALHPEDDRPDEVIDAIAARKVGIAPEGEKPPVDLSRLLSYNENRSKNPPKPKKKKPPRAERPERPLQVPKASLTSSERAQGFLRKAMEKRVQEVDGENIINTSSEAKTELGKLLDMNAFSPFRHPELGKFNSVGGFWFYLAARNPDESFRTLSGDYVRKRGYHVEKRQIEGFRILIAEATWIKVASNDKLMEMMLANTLPYRHYHSVGEMNIAENTAIGAWFVPVIEEIAATLKMMKEKQDKYLPDFSFLERPPFARPRAPRNDKREERNDSGDRRHRSARPQRT